MARGLYRSIVAALALGLSASALAHHSDRIFDAVKTVEIRGTVVEFTLMSPHSRLVVERATARPGRTERESERWEIQAPSLGEMLRTLGIKPNTFEPGQQITVIARPHRDGFPLAKALLIVRADGRAYSMSDDLASDAELLSKVR
jgi:hypothetical protein